MNEESIKMILDKIDALTAKLGIAATQFYPLAYREVMTGAVLLMLLGIVCFVVIYFLWLNFWTKPKEKKKASGDYFDEDVAIPLWIASSILVVFGTLFFVLNLHTVINGRYYAIKSIIDMFN